MFKIGKIKKIENDKITIKVVEHEQCSAKKGKTIYKEIKSLSFEIKADKYSFVFVMEKDLKTLLDIPMNKSIDFSEYLFHGETFFDINKKESFMDPPMDIRIYRYLENSYEITIHFDTSKLNSDIDYSGFIQFDFDLNNFLDK